MHLIPTLIVGGGTAGASVACALGRRGAGQGVTLVDVDLFGTVGSSASSAGGVQCLFPDALDVGLALESIEYFRRHASTLGYREQGSLWLCDADSLRRSQEWLAGAAGLGVTGECLTPTEARNRFPVLGDLNDVAGAVLTRPGGFLSTHKLRIHYLNHAQAGGVTLLDHWQVVSIRGDEPPLRVGLRRVAARAVRKTLSENIAPAEDLVIEAGQIINAAGPWSAQCAALYGSTLPVEAAARHIYLVRQPAMDFQSLPVFLDGPQDIAFRYGEFERKPCLMVTGERSCAAGRIDFTPHDYRDTVEPRLIRRIPGMAGAEVCRGWVSHDNLSADGRPIVGKAPGRAGVYNFNAVSVRQISTVHTLAEALAGYLITNQWGDRPALDELNQARFARPGVSTAGSVR